MDSGHWFFPKEFDIDDWFGFIYRIIEIDTGMEYIGKKQFHSHLKKSVKGRKNKKSVVKENDWKSYTGSSVRLNEEIKKKGMDNYIFLIESLHKTRGSLYYAEVERQIVESVLTTQLPSGQRKYYNGQISAVKFIPPPEEIIELEYKVSSLLKTRTYNSLNQFNLTEEDLISIKGKYLL